MQPLELKGARGMAPALASPPCARRSSALLLRPRAALSSGCGSFTAGRTLAAAVQGLGSKGSLTAALHLAAGAWRGGGWVWGGGWQQCRGASAGWGGAGGAAGAGGWLG